MAFWRHYYHLVWATKYRDPLIRADMQPALYAFLHQKAIDLDVLFFAANGTADHVHLVVSVPPATSVASVVKALKGASSRFVNAELHPDSHFAWQAGYGSLTLGERQRAAAIDHVQRQQEHHQRFSTNAWLERWNDESDDEPAQGVSDGASSLSALREDSGAYDVVLDLPW